MKRCLAYILTLAIIISELFNLMGNTKNVKAYNASIKAGDVSCKAGEQVVVPIEIDGEINFCNIGIEIDYDTEVLELISADNVMSAAVMYTPSQNISKIPYNMDWSSVSEIKYSGKIAELTFIVKATDKTGSYVIGVDYYKGRNGQYTDGVDVNYDADENPLNLSYVSGSIDIVSDYEPLPTEKPTKEPEATKEPAPTDAPSQPTPAPTVVPGQPVVTPPITQVGTPNQPVLNNPQPNQTTGNSGTKVSLKKVKGLSLKGKKGIIKIKWKKSNSKEYEIQIATNKKFKKKKYKSKRYGTSLNLYIKKGTYYVRVRACKYTNNKYVYGSWSSVKKCKVK